MAPSIFLPIRFIVKTAIQKNIETALWPILTQSINKVISLPPEFITPQDGNNKQDCENTAAKRWLNQYAPTIKELGVAITGDDLNQTFS